MRFLNNVKRYNRHLSFFSKECVVQLKDSYSCVYFTPVNHPRLCSGNGEICKPAWVIYDPYPFMNRDTFAAGSRALSGIALSLVKIATTREERGSPRARSDRRGRIRRWLPKDLVRYQENRRSLAAWEWKGEREKRESGQTGPQANAVSKCGNGGKRETQGEGTRRRKRDSWWGWCSWSTWALLRVSRSVVLSVVLSAARRGSRTHRISVEPTVART